MLNHLTPRRDQLTISLPMGGGDPPFLLHLTDEGSRVVAQVELTPAALVTALAGRGSMPCEYGLQAQQSTADPETELAVARRDLAALQALVGSPGVLALLRGEKQSPRLQSDQRDQVLALYADARHWNWADKAKDAQPIKLHHVLDRGAGVCERCGAVVSVWPDVSCHDPRAARS